MHPGVVLTEWPSQPRSQRPLAAEGHADWGGRECWRVSVQRGGRLTDTASMQMGVLIDKGIDKFKERHDHDGNHGKPSGSGKSNQ